MTQAEIIYAVANKAGTTLKDTKAVITSLLATITDELAMGNRVMLNGFGGFEVRERAARTGRNPKTGEAVEIAASKNVGFKAAKALKEAVNK